MRGHFQEKGGRQLCCSVCVEYRKVKGVEEEEEEEEDFMLFCVRFDFGVKLLGNAKCTLPEEKAMPIYLLPKRAQ